MRFADPFTVTCPSCNRTGSYATRELIALRARCEHCSVPLEAVGQRMRTQLAEVGVFVAKMDMALELERMFNVIITDPELESIQRPADFAPYLQPSSRKRNVEASILAALALARREPVDQPDIHRTFDELFPFTEDA